MKTLNLLVFLLFCGTLEAQNLLENPDFDTDLSGWTLTGPVAPVWDPFDVDASPASGSALITNAEADAESDIEVLSQCIITGADRYVWAVKAFIPSGQARTGSVVLRYSYQANTFDCSGGFVSGGGVLITNLDAWTDSNGNPVTISPEQVGTGGSMKLSIALRKTEAGGTFTAYVDSAVLHGDAFLKDSFEQSPSR